MAGTGRSGRQPARGRTRALQPRTTVPAHFRRQLDWATYGAAEPAGGTLFQGFYGFQEQVRV